MLTEYAPIDFVEHISPTPLLMLSAYEDVLCLTDRIAAAYEKARQPKRFKILPGGHFDAYVAGFEQSSGPARDWFVEHLGA
jgi:alpha-beta hydrolase superfamily lysophospholipase